VHFSINNDGRLRQGCLPVQSDREPLWNGVSPKTHSFYHGYETRVSAQGIEFRIRPQPDHPATTKFLHDTVVRNGFADQRIGGWHVPHILSCSPKQVNERRLAAQTARNVLPSLKSWNE